MPSVPPLLPPLSAALAALLFAASGATAADGPPPAACPGNPEALGTARTILVDPATTPPVGLKTYPRSLDLADREVVLTFDDGPSPATTPRVLAALEHECVKATFFLIGRNAAGAPALVKHELEDGDTVGHHTFSHPAVTERGLPEAAAKADIERGFEADDKAGYGAVAAEPKVPFFRFPGFGDSEPLLAWLKGRHIAVFGADLWASDWTVQTPEQELALLMGRLHRAGRGIILLHDARPQTAAMLPTFLATLKAEGYKVVRVAPGAGPTPLAQAAPGWRSETEDAVAAAARRGRHPPAAEAMPPEPAPFGEAAPAPMPEPAAAGGVPLRR